MISRRQLLQSGLVLSTIQPATAKQSDSLLQSFSVDQQRVRLYSKSVNQPVKLLFVSDTHLWRDDARGTSFAEYSGRMAKAYNATKHFLTQEPTNPEKEFQAALTLAKKENVDLLALIGDIVSFPSEAAINWVQEQLKDFPIPYVYTAGNHDWHYEGMEGSLRTLRASWIEKRLKPLYQGRNPLLDVQNVQGVQIITLDNSIYEIEEQQLAGVEKALATGKPCVLMMHIPLYAPGRSIGYGCGHPQWGWETDKNYTIERRERWPKTGHTRVTQRFYQKVIDAPNLLGVFAGHVHRPGVDAIQGKPQVVSEANATGGYLVIEILPTV
ncbi:calcineurin-like phosphoesterase family protein [Larkinella arboricola]|uniref:Calcineurin-like phosphoesterase family protein n=1 Tax=Larkinella arboricola TaxID=643671 RepID=A0A327X0S0_LARAB|nr:metallophosphoesterase [Larkinella arboricola]RAJ99831.1 calcineurin-like phosphoesterase family protein [Larkinella arboricola]